MRVRFAAVQLPMRSGRPEEKPNPRRTRKLLVERNRVPAAWPQRCSHPSDSTSKILEHLELGIQLEEN